MPSQRNRIPLTIVFQSSVDMDYFDSIGEWSSKTVRVACPECGSVQNIQKRLITGKGHSFCRPCGDSLSRLIDITGKRYGKLTVVGYSHSYGKSSYWNVLCDCGNKHVAEKQNIKRGHVKSCGCAVKNNGAKLFGIDHPNWNPRLTDEERVSRRDTTENTEWRGFVFDRDGYKCVICGAHGRINAHHLNSYTFTPHMRYDRSNGITMCVSEHRELHRIYGNKYNTGIQFLSYLDTVHFSYDTDDLEFV